jgi:hypothetical protein
MQKENSFVRFQAQERRRDEPPPVDPLGTLLDIAEFVIDQRPVACLLWVISGCAARQRRGRSTSIRGPSPREPERAELKLRNLLTG